MKVVYTDGFMKDLEKLTSFRHRILSIPGDFYRSIKWSIQRHVRGYADCDLWSMDDALGKIIIKHLKAFKKMNRMGYQMMSGETKEDKDGCTVPANPDADIKAWEDCIDGMIEGFEYMIADDTERKPYKLFLEKKISKEEWIKREKEDNEAAKKKAYMFIDYFNALWD